MVMSSSTNTHITDSRHRFAEALSNARQQHQNSQVSAQNKQSTQNSSSSALPINHTLSGVALKKLVSLLGMVNAGRNRSSMTPLKLAEKVTAMELLLLHARGGLVPADELGLGSATQELDDAPLESLSPELQELKRGFELLPFPPDSMQAGERRINQLLRANGEMEKLQIVFSNCRVDSSTTPPTRVRKTESEHDDDAEGQRVQMDDLRKRKPQVRQAVLDIMSELVKPGMVVEEISPGTSS